MDLSVIIVNWNTGCLLKKCLESVYKKTDKISFEIIVVDNASRDNSVFLALKTGLKFELIQNKENKGFAAANNEAMKKAKGEFLIFLNPDTELKNNALEKMVSYMRQNQNVKILGPKLLNSDNTIQRSVRAFPNFLDQALIILKLHHFFPKISALKKYFQTDFDYEKTQNADQIMGAALMIRKNDFEKFGFFDEKFYVWFEEVDLCKRVKEKGEERRYFKDAEIVHHGSVSFSQQLSLKKQWNFTKSLLYYFKKHNSFWQYLGLAFLSLFGLVFSIPLLIPKKKIPFFYLGFSGVAAISLFLFLLFSQKAGILFLTFSFVGFLAFKYPRSATLALIAFLPFLPILKDADVIPAITLIKDFLIAALFCFVIYKNLRNKKIIFLINTFSVLIGLLVSWSIVSFFLADNKIIGILRLRDIILYILVFFIVFEFVKKKKHLKQLISVLLLSSIFVLTLAPIQLLFFKDSMVKRFDPTSNSWHPRVASSLAHPSIFGEYLVIIFSLALPLLIFQKKFKNILLWIVIFASLLFIYLTYSRGAWLGAAASLATILFFLKDKILARKRILLAIGILAIIATYVLMFYTKVPIYLATLVDKQYQSNQERLYVVYSLIGEGNTAKGIFGKGLGDTIVGRREVKKIGLFEIFSFESETVQEAKAQTLVDNQYLKTFAEMGIIGLVILLAIFYFIIKTAYNLIALAKSRFIKSILIGITAMMVSFIVQGATIDIFEIFPTNILFWVFSGILMAIYYKKFEL